MPNPQRIILLFFITFFFVATSARADEVIIERGDGPASISIRNTKPSAMPDTAPPAKASPATAGADAATGSPEHQATMAVIHEVLAEYSAKNKYSELTETQCKQMSEAIWYRLRVKGLDVRLAAGNVKRNVVGAGIDMYVRLANHAWVMAKTPDQGWLALECTNGSVVQRQDNPLYYTGGLFFRTPDEVYRFDARRRDMRNAAKRYNALATQWNSNFKGKRLKQGSELAAQRDQLRNDLAEAKQRFTDATESLVHLYNNSMVLVEK